MLYTGNIEYHCCNKEKRGNEIWVWCGHPAKGSNWFIAFKLILLVVYFLACLFWPVRLLIVPADYLFTSVENNENEIPKAELLSDEIPVDDLSPITCSTLLKKCVTHFTTTGNFFKLFCFYYIFIPFSVYIYLALHYTLLLDFLSEIEAKNAFEDGAMIFNYVFDIRNKLYCLLLALVLFVILPGMVLFSIESKPHYVNKLQNAVRKNLKLLPKSISPHHECFKYSLKTAISEIIPGPYKITKTSLNYTSNILFELCFCNCYIRYTFPALCCYMWDSWHRFVNVFSFTFCYKYNDVFPVCYTSCIPGKRICKEFFGWKKIPRNRTTESEEKRLLT